MGELTLRVGQVVGVPDPKSDGMIMATVQGIRMEKRRIQGKPPEYLELTSTVVNHDVYGIVAVQVLGQWYSIEDVAHYDPDYVELLESATI